MLGTVTRGPLPVSDRRGDPGEWTDFNVLFIVIQDTKGCAQCNSIVKEGVE